MRSAKPFRDAFHGLSNVSVTQQMWWCNAIELEVSACSYLSLLDWDFVGACDRVRGMPMALADVTDEQRAHLRLAFDSVQTAGQLYQNREFEKAGSDLIVALKALGDGLRNADAET